MSTLDRYYAAACQIDLPNPTMRSEIAARVRRMLEMVDMAVVGYEPFHDVKLVRPACGAEAGVSDAIEKFSVRIKTLQAIASCNVVILVMDAHQGIGEQDATLAGHIVESGRALVIAVNKWDGLQPDQRAAVKDAIARKLPFLDFASTHFISALHGSGVVAARRSRCGLCQRHPRPADADPDAAACGRGSGASAAARAWAPHQAALCTSGRPQSAHRRHPRQPDR